MTKKEKNKKVEKTLNEKKNYRPIIVIGIVILFLMYFMISNVLKPKPKFYQDGLPVKLSNITPYYSDDTKEKAIGLSDYTFVGKINKILRTEHIKTKDEENKKIDYMAYTIYSVQVMKNIKEKLITSENIEIDFLGGLSRDEKSLELTSGLDMFQEGEYYILLPTIWKEEGPLEISSGNQAIRLGKEYDEKNEMVVSYINAYKYQEVPDEGTYMEPKQYFKSIYDIENN